MWSKKINTKINGVAEKAIVFNTLLNVQKLYLIFVNIRMSNITTNAPRKNILKKIKIGMKLLPFNKSMKNGRLQEYAQKSYRNIPEDEKRRWNNMEEIVPKIFQKLRKKQYNFLF